MAKAVLVSVSVLIAACSRTPQQKEAVFLRDGRKHLQQGDFARAVIDFSNAAKAAPKDTQPHFELAQAYGKSGNVQGEVNELVKTVGLDPANVAAQLRLAEILTANRNLEVVQEGRKRAEQALGLSPDNPDALFALATAELRLEDPAEAAQHLEQALQAVPQHLKASTLLSMMKLRNNDVSGAEEVMRKAATEAPRSPEHALALGRFYLLIRKPADAEKEFRRALEIDRANGPALAALANMMYRAGNTAEADRLFQQASALPDKAYRPLHAIFLLETGKADAAIAEFKQLYQTHRKDRDARTWLVSAYVRRGRYAEGEKVLSEALKENSKDTDALVQRGEVFLLQGRYQQAEADLWGFLGFFPNSAEGHLILARIQRALGAPASHRQELTEALRLNPKLLAARIELAHSLTLDNAAKTAIELLDEAPAEDRQTLAVITEKNAALYALGDDAAMRKGIDQGLAFGRTPELLLQDGLLRSKQGDYARSRAALEEALERRPQEWRALEALALTYTAQKKVPEATAVVRKYTSRLTQSADAQQFLGLWLIRIGDLAGAREAFQAAKALAADSTQPDFQLAELDLREGKLDSARGTLLRLLGRRPRNLALLLDMGQVEYRAGRLAEAISYYNQAVREDPKSVPALNNLAFLLADTGKDPDRALQLAQQVKELSPNDPTVDDTIGWSYYKKGLFETAIRYLRQSKSASPRWKCHLAMAYIGTGRRQEAKAILQSALKEDPQVPEARRVLALLGTNP